ncbi:crotonase/enoyl-CoA hydratase family protein [Nocardia sp. NPDC059246]|uniref:crotonase/enoyl-CoA hydratase family protein n=1 Tax=unclassified Nocardia TaxID=2637762 RepID=UPI003680EA1D
MTVQFEIVDGVAIVMLNRPDVHNAIDVPTAEALADAVDEIDRNDEVVVGVLSGVGKTFCAGTDLKAYHSTGRLPVTQRRGGYGILERPPTKPMVAAVQGQALGGGFELALACDLIVAESGARFALPEVKFGLLPVGGGILRLPRRIPRALALEMILTGEGIDAERAAELGLVNRLVSVGDGLDAALVLARSIAGNAPLSVRVGKQLFDESADWSREEAFARQAVLADPVLNGHDATEGARAFVERRRPVWTGA